MNSPTHIDSIPGGMLIDVRQQRAGPGAGEPVRWRPEWNEIARRGALSGMSAVQIARQLGCTCQTVQVHLISQGFVYGGKVAGWVEIQEKT